MPNVYVSKTATNGFGVGNDANSYAQAQVMATPWLTWTKALLSATAGDTIYGNDGIYAEAALLNPQKANYTLLPFNAGQVTIQTANAPDTRVLSLTTLGTGLVLGGLIFDAQNVQLNCITSTGGSFPAAVTMHGPTFKNYTTNGLSVGDVGTFILDGTWSVLTGPTVNAGAGVSLGPTTPNAPNCSYKVTGGTITLGTISVASAYGISGGGVGTKYNVSGVTISATITGNTTFAGIRFPNYSVETVSNCTITQTISGDNSVIYGILASQAGGSFTATGNTVTQNVTGGTANNQVYGIRLFQGGGASVSGNTVNQTATADVSFFGIHLDGQGVLSSTWNTVSVLTPNMSAVANVNPISIILPSAGVVTRATIQNCTVTTTPGNTSTLAGSIGITMGSNSSGGTPPTGADLMYNTVVSQNTVSGGNHGILLGWISNGACYGNDVSNCLLALIDKHGNPNGVGPNQFFYNSVHDMTGVGGALRAKASVGTIFSQNKVLFSALMAANSAPGIYVENDPGAPAIDSSGITFQSNIFYAATARLDTLVIINAGQSANFSANTYYAGGGFTGNPWQYQGNGYANLAAWMAAKEVSAKGTDPNLRPLVFR